MSTSTPTSSVRSLDVIRVFEILLIVGMIFMAVAVVGAIIDKPGLDLSGSTQPTVDAGISSLTDIGDLFPTKQTDDGRVIDAATSQAPVSIGDPVTAQLTFLDPTSSQRVIWVLWTVSEPLLALIGTWLVFSIVRSSRTGDPFVAANTRRLWALALVIAVGGTGYSLLSGAAQMLLIQRSAAADQIDLSFTASFLPIIIGIGVAVLASVWKVGVELRDDVDGMI